MLLYINWLSLEVLLKDPLVYVIALVEHGMHCVYTVVRIATTPRCIDIIVVFPCARLQYV